MHECIFLAGWAIIVKESVEKTVTGDLGCGLCIQVYKSLTFQKMREKAVASHYFSLIFA